MDYDLPDGVKGLTQDTADNYSSDNEINSTAIVAANMAIHCKVVERVMGNQCCTMWKNHKDPLLHINTGQKMENIMLTHLDLLETGNDGVGIIQMTSTIHGKYSNEGNEEEFDEDVKTSRKNGARHDREVLE